MRRGPGAGAAQGHRDKHARFPRGVGEPSFPGLAAGARLPVVAVILGVLVVIIFFSTVSFAQTSPYSADLSNAGSVLTTHFANYSPIQSGTFRFSWHTTDGGTVTFSLLSPSGRSLYSSTAGAGAGSAYVVRAGNYQFEMSGSVAETVRVTGTLSFSAPLI